jgi:hypothetical protein
MIKFARFNVYRALCTIKISLSLSFIPLGMYKTIFVWKIKRD